VKELATDTQGKIADNFNDGLPLNSGRALQVPKTSVPMRTVFATTAALAAAIALAAPTGTSLNSHAIAPIAQAILDGVILGSSAWPSVPVNALNRLQLSSVGCDEGAQCRLTPVESLD